MFIKAHKSWTISEYHATDEAIYLNRRQLLAKMGMAGAGIAASQLPFSGSDGRAHNRLSCPAQ